MEKNLKNLIPVSISEYNNLLISARDFHDFLGIKANFRSWYPRLIDYGFVENEDYRKVYEKNSTIGGKKTVVDYMMTLKMAKEIATIHHSEKGKQARRYFINVEKKFRSAQFAMKSLLEMTELNMKNGKVYDEEDCQGDDSIYDDEVDYGVNQAYATRDIYEGGITYETNPTCEYGNTYKGRGTYGENQAYEYGNTYENSDTYGVNPTCEPSNIYPTSGTYESSHNHKSSKANSKKNRTTNYGIEEKSSTLNTNFRDTSKLFGIRENLLVNWLIINNYIYRDKKGNIKPYAKVMEYFQMREFIAESGHSGIQTLINPKGREFFRKVLVGEKIIKEVKLLE